MNVEVCNKPQHPKSLRELLDIPVIHVQCTTKPWVNSSILGGGGGFRYLFMFTPIWGKIPILTNMFQLG